MYKLFLINLNKYLSRFEFRNIDFYKKNEFQKNYVSFKDVSQINH